MPSNPQVYTTTRATAVPLASTETVIFRARKNMYYLFSPLLLVSVIGGALAWVISLISNQFADNYVFILQIGIIAMTIFIDILIWLDWLSTIYTLTNRRVQYRFGIIGEQNRTIALNQITDSRVEIPVLGRLFNFGGIYIDAAHINSTIIFKYISSAENRKSQIDEAISGI